MTTRLWGLLLLLLVWPSGASAYESLGKAEDSAAVSGDVGVQMLCVRHDTSTTGLGVNGDYAPCSVNASGYLYVSSDVTAVVPGTGASSLGKAEGAAHGSGDTGVFVLGRRIDAVAASSTTSGDYEAFNMDASGRLWTNPGYLGIEDAAETAGGNLAMAGTVRRDTAASSAGTTGDNATLNTDASGLLWVNTELAAATAAPDAGGGAAPTAPEVWAYLVCKDSVTNLYSPCVNSGNYVEDAASVGGEQLILSGVVRQDTLASNTSLDGDYTYLKTTSAGRLYVDAVLSSALPAGTNAIGKLSANSGVDIGDVDVTSVAGNVTVIQGTGTNLHTVCDAGCGSATQYAEDTTGTDGELLNMMGAIRQDSLTDLLSANGDRSNLKVDALGRLWVTGTYVEDAAETAGGLLAMAGTVRRDTAASSAGTTGDNATLNTDATGNLWVNASGQTLTVAAHAVTNAGTFATQVDGNALTALQLIDNLPNTIGSTTSGQSGALSLGAVTTAAPTYTTAQTHPLSLDTAGALRIAGAISCSNCSGSGASAVDDAAFTIATGSVAPAGFLADQTTPDSVDEGDVGLARMTLARIQLHTLWDAAGNERGANVNASNELLVAVSSIPSHAVTNAGTFVVQENGAALTSLQLIDDIVGVEDAAETAGGGLARMGSVRRDTAASSAGTDGDNATINTDSTGRLWTNPGFIGIEDAAETAGGNLDMIGSVRRDVALASAGTTGDNATLNTDALGLLWVRGLDPCNGVAKVAVPFSFSTATTTQLVAASASNKVYVCALNIVTTAANNVALIEDDTAACASPTAGMAGGTTAATGWNFAANGGMTLGNGNGTVTVSAATNRYVCLINSAATQTSGTLMYALAP